MSVSPLWSLGGSLLFGSSGQRDQRRLTRAQIAALEEQLRQAQEQWRLGKETYALNKDFTNYDYSRAQTLNNERDSLYNNVLSGLFNGNSAEGQAAEYAAYRAPVVEEFQRAQDQLANQMGSRVNAGPGVAGQYMQRNAGSVGAGATNSLLGQQAGILGAFRANQAVQNSPTNRAQRLMGVSPLLGINASAPRLQAPGLNAGAMGDVAAGYGNAAATAGSQGSPWALLTQYMLQQQELKKTRPGGAK